MVNELTGKVAIVTGGASGLGEGLVRRFAAEGAKVLIGDIDRDSGNALAKDIGADALFVEADVSDIDQVSGLVSTAVDRFGGLHVMVNNAGVSGTMHRRFLDDDLADFHKVMAINVQAVMAGTRDAARHMSKARRRIDHQPHIDRRNPSRRRRNDIPRVEGRGHSVHQVRSD